MKPFLFYFNAAIKGTFLGLWDIDLWRGLGEGLWCLFVLLVRVLILFSLPLSAPFIAWLLLRGAKKRYTRETEERARLRRGMHQNGPGV